MSGMDLLSSIPGLAAHQVEVPPPQPPAFDRERAERLVADGLSIIASLYPVGSLEWLRANRPDVVRYLVESEDELQAAVDAEDLPRLLQGIESWTKRHRRAWEIFNTRPPVIDVQEQLFVGAA